MMNSAIVMDARNAWNETWFTASASPAPACRATSTPMPVKMDMMNVMTTRKIWNDTPTAALPA